LKRGVHWLAAVGGFTTSLAVAWWISTFGTGGLLDKTRQFSGAAGQNDFGSGFWMPWQYLFHAEQRIFLIFIWAMGQGVCVLAQERRF